jgi:HEAT repeat protein
MIWYRRYDIIPVEKQMLHKLILGLFFALPPSCFAQAPGLLNALKSDDWTVRMNAFYQLRKNTTGEATQAAILQLLERESQESMKQEAAANRLVWKPQAGTEGEAHGEYYGDLVQTVASLHTEKAARTLAAAAGGGKMIDDEMVRWPKAVTPLLLDQMLTSQSLQQRVNSSHRLAIVLTNSESRKQLSAQQIREIMQGFEKMLGDEIPIMRITAISAYESLSDVSRIPALRQMAQDDPDSGVRRVAQRAAAALETLRNKK